MSLLTSDITTASELLAQSSTLGRCELIRGEVRTLSPSSAGHGVFTARVTLALGAFVQRHELGEVFGAETGFLIERNPDTVRAPDAAFVRRSRLADLDLTGFFVGPPDLACEVVSPHDRPREVAAKAASWIKAGAEFVWVIDPGDSSAAVYEQRAAV